MKKTLVLLAVTVLTTAQSFAQNAATFKTWGQETLGLIESKFRYKPSDKYTVTTSNLWYRESTKSGDYHATCWPLGVYIKAIYYANTTNNINWAGEILKRMHKGDSYLTNYKGYAAYEACYKLTNTRHYDDNAWIVKDLMDMYELTNDVTYLNNAKQIMLFCMSGERNCKANNCSCGKNYEGGIRFHETHSAPTHEEHDNWATCATAPTAVANLKLYKATQDEKYLTDGKRLYDFMKKEIWGIGPGYRAYENAVIMQAALYLYEITEEEQYLTDAYQLAYSMEAIYMSWSDQILHEVGKWGGHDMADAYVHLYNIDKNERWLGVVAGYASYAYNNCKDVRGFYPEDWSNTTWKTETTANSEYHLIETASAAAVYFKLAQTPVTGPKKKEPVCIFKDKAYNKKDANGNPSVTGVECGHSAWAIGLLPGKYTYNDLHKMGRIDNRFRVTNVLSSIHIDEGYSVTLYATDNFKGASITLDASTAALSSTWVNRVSSIIVEDLNPASVEEVESDNSLEVFPTAFIDRLTVKNLSGEAQVSLIDLSGKTWKSVTMDGANFMLDTHDIPAGVYLLRVKEGQNEQVVKVIKNNQ